MVEPGKESNCADRREYLSNLGCVHNEVHSRSSTVDTSIVPGLRYAVLAMWHADDGRFVADIFFPDDQVTLVPGVGNSRKSRLNIKVKTVDSVER